MIGVDQLGFRAQDLDRLVDSLSQADWPRVVEELLTLLGPLTAVLLYGSRSRGHQHAHSDYDLLAVGGAAGEGLRWSYGGLDLDIELAGPALWEEPLEGRLYLSQGVILLDRDGSLRIWLERLQQRRAQGPTPLSPGLRLREAAWLERMILRSQSGDSVAALRRAALAARLPELAVEILGRWPGSPRQNLELLLVEWPALAQVLEDWARATDPGAQLATLVRAVELCRKRLLG